MEGRGKGGHALARYQGKQTTVPVHGDIDYAPEFIKKICKQLGLNPKGVLVAKWGGRHDEVL